MSDKTKIEWTDATFNFWEGCTKVGPGCDHCYAEARSTRFAGGRSVHWGAGAPRRLTSERNRNNLRRWARKRFCECGECHWRGEFQEAVLANGLRCPGCGARGEFLPARRRVFCSSLSDVFDNEVPQEWRDALFVEMEATPSMDKLVLTKRIGNVRKMVPASWLEPGGWPSHVWIGATIVNQAEADRDVPKLLALPALVLFLSMEPLLGPVDLTRIEVWGGDAEVFPLKGTTNCVDDEGAPAPDIPALSWVIVGGESGAHARPMHPDWARGLRDQCDAAQVPFLFKQWGEWSPPSSLDDLRFLGDKMRAGKAVYMPGDDREPDVRFKRGMEHMLRVAKPVAGRLADGRTWAGVPTVRQPS